MHGSRKSGLVEVKATEIELTVITPKVNSDNGMFKVYILVYSPGVVVTGVLRQGIAEVTAERLFTTCHYLQWLNGSSTSFTLIFLLVANFTLHCQHCSHIIFFGK